MLSNNKGLAIAAVLLTLADGSAWATPPQYAGKIGQGAMVDDAQMPLGPPYAVDNVTYTPADQLSYDEVGYADESQEASQGGTTANGETFVPTAVTAAHKTLPLPSYVEVTELDSGRTILVRVNDRGPMRNDQLITLSPGAAAQVGVDGKGAIPVRVRRVNPPEQERAALRRQGQAAERLETPAALLKALRTKLGPNHGVAIPPAQQQIIAKTQPVPAADPVNPTTATGAGADFGKPAMPSHITTQPARPAVVAQAARRSGYVVQVGAFASKVRAETLAKKLGARVEAGGGLWRVRIGPYVTQQAAQAGVRSAAAKGFKNVQVVANDAQ